MIRPPKSEPPVATPADTGVAPDPGQADAAAPGVPAAAPSVASGAPKPAAPKGRRAPPAPAGPVRHASKRHPGAWRGNG